MLVTADHSTPVMFRDHSHEPVPLVVAPVAAAAAVLGEAALAAVDLGPLPRLTQHSVVAEGLLEAQAAAAAARLAARGEVAGFDEVAAAHGALGRFPASELMPLVRGLTLGTALQERH